VAAHTRTATAEGSSPVALRRTLVLTEWHDCHAIQRRYHTRAGPGAVPHTCHTPGAFTVSDGKSRMKRPSNQRIRQSCSRRFRVTDLPKLVMRVRFLRPLQFARSNQKPQLKPGVLQTPG
jgi:hypothetical protein